MNPVYATEEKTNKQIKPWKTTNESRQMHTSMLLKTNISSIKKVYYH